MDRLSTARSASAQSRDVLNSLQVWPSAQAKAWVTSFVERVCPDNSTAALVLIGSIARPVERVTDVDLLYVYHNRPIDFQDHPIDVDIRAYGASDMHERVARGHDVLSWAVRFGRLICESDQFWTLLVRSFAERLPFPNPEVAEERADRSRKVYEELLEIGDRDAACEQRVSLLTHLAWARLLRAGIHPASRPELAQQLRSIGERLLANDIQSAINDRIVEQGGSTQHGVR